MATAASGAGRQAKLELALRLALLQSTDINIDAFLGNFPAHIVEKHRELLLDLRAALPKTLENAVLVRALCTARLRC